MTNDQMILLHTALTHTGANAANGAALDLALRLLGHWRIANKLENAIAHCLYAEREVARAEAALPPNESSAFGNMLDTSPAFDAALALESRYAAEWAEIVAEIKAVADELEARIDSWAYANHQEGQVPS